LAASKAPFQPALSVIVVPLIAETVPVSVAAASLASQPGP
jgi:hypothetical protein